MGVPAEGNDGAYWLVSGTSPACALAAGVAALIKSADPALPPDQVREAITTTTSHRPAGGYNDEVGFGTVDAAAALTAAARLSTERMAGPGSRTGLRKAAALEPGFSADSHYGGGLAAVPPAPVAPRGLRQLVMFCLLAAICLAMIGIATSRLLLMRLPGTGARTGRTRRSTGIRPYRRSPTRCRPIRQARRARPHEPWPGSARRRRRPARPDLDDYASRVLDVAESIPRGRVMSYGDIAEYLGEGGPRQVGRVMALWGGGVAWWRVIHADGSLLAGHERAALARYQEEGTPMRLGADGRPGRVDMRRARWSGAD